MKERTMSFESFREIYGDDETEKILKEAMSKPGVAISVILETEDGVYRIIIAKE